MIRFFVRYRRPIFIGTVVIFLLGTFVGLGGYLITDMDLSDAVAEVGEAKISRTRFEVQARGLAERLRGEGQDLDAAAEDRLRQELLRDMIVEELFAGEAGRLGLVVTDMELADDIRRTFEREGAFDQTLYFQAVQSQFRMTPEQYEDMRRKQLLAFKFRQWVSRSVKISPSELRGAYIAEKGSIQGFEEEKTRFQLVLQQRRSLETLNHLLKRLADPSVTQIKSYLQARET